MYFTSLSIARIFQIGNRIIENSRWGILLKRLTFGMIGALSITLLIGCTSNSNETKASNKEASTTVKEKEIVYENVMFEQKK